MGRTIYAIGDIHGDLEQLRVAHDRIARDSSTNPHVVVHVGDLVDRRENSKGVIDFVMNGIASGAPWIALKGNHDRLFQWFLEDASRVDPVLRPDYNWLHPRMGGRDTLRSYGLEVGEDYDIHKLSARANDLVPKPHYSFLSKLPLSHEIGEYFFVHAGIRPGVALADQTEDDLLWIRQEFLQSTARHPKIIVHGHTPVETVVHHGNRINIDTGAAWGFELSTIVIEETDVFLLTGKGRVKLPKSTN